MLEQHGGHPESLDTIPPISEGIKTCPDCGLELVGENAVCACDSSLPSRLRAGAPAKDPFIGTILNGTYEIQDLVGRGGMGCVYKARDILMERTVAIKMLHSHLVQDKASTLRFQQEARAASAINHPNVITAYDFGILETGQPYLIMDFLQGSSLSATIDESNGLEYARAIHIFAQTCDALHVAHTKGVIHRDLKPSNIMIVQNRDDPDFVKIVDFGIAKLLPHSGKQSQNLTQTGELFGSPLYMSPEQFLGKPLDVRTDIYAMGCVMYEALMGRPPFSGEHVLETMHKHIHEMPMKFSAARPDIKIPAKLETICARALEKEPDARYQTMAELRDAILLTIEGARDTRTLGARLQSIRSQLKRARKKNEKWLRRGQFVALGLAGAAVVGGSIWFISLGDRDQQWVNLRHEAQEAYRRGDLKTAESKFFNAGKVAKELYGDEDPKYLDTLEKLAWIYEEQGAQGGYAKARKLFRKVKGLTPEDVMRFKAAQILAYTPVSQLRNLEKQNVLKGPETALKAGIKELEKYIGPTDPGLIVLYQSLAETYERQRHFAEAEDARIKLVSIREDSQGQDSIGVADARVDLANLYMEWGKDVAAKKAYDDAQRTFAEARESYETAVKVYQELVGAACDKIPPIKKSLGECKKLEAEAAENAKSTPQTNQLPEYK
jgi:serine/threonine protein kinase